MDYSFGKNEKIQISDFFDYDSTCIGSIVNYHNCEIQEKIGETCEPVSLENIHVNLKHPVEITIDKNLTQGFNKNLCVKCNGQTFDQWNVLQKPVVCDDLLEVPGNKVRNINYN